LCDNKEIILDAGGGTGKLAFFVKMEYGKQKFKELISTNNTANIHNSIITPEMINNALIRYQKHLADRIPDKNRYYDMYS
jgi:ubiquinone/menaquinone biosynthesis C-methylase UbiE